MSVWRSKHKNSKLKFLLKKRKQQVCWDKNQKGRKDSSGSTWMNTKGRSHPQSQGNSVRKKKKYKTNLAYVIVFLKVRPGRGQIIGNKYSWSLSNMGLNCAGPLICGLFFPIVTYYSTTRSEVGWIRWCSTMDTEAECKLYLDFWLHWGSTPLTANPLHIVQGSAIFWITT